MKKSYVLLAVICLVTVFSACKKKEASKDEVLATKYARYKACVCPTEAMDPKAKGVAYLAIGESVVLLEEFKVKMALGKVVNS